jgi:DNA polymerase-1
VQPGPALAVAVADQGVALASADGVRTIATGHPADVLFELDAGGPRWVWWSARETVAPLWPAGWRPRACWDLAAVSRLLYGGNRDEPDAVWSVQHGLPFTAPSRRGAHSPDLHQLDLRLDDATDNATDDSADGGEPIRADGSLSREWAGGGWRSDLGAAARWAALALQLQQQQRAALQQIADSRMAPTAVPLAVLTAHAESAAALLAVELEHVGLPVDADAMAAILRPVIGERPVDERHAAAQRRTRDDAVRRLFPHSDDVDLRSPGQVRDMLVRVGLDLPDTRSWRLEPHAQTSDAVRALLAWRKAERLATTYGWSWLDRDLAGDGRLRGTWVAAEGAGRMTASAGLHNMPAELRPAVRAVPGSVFVRADLGQVEPRVLAAVSGDPSLADAAREDDMYAPVAAALRCDRPTAKVAVLAAMYGQTTGAAGSALRDMDRAYPQAMAYLRTAEEAGRTGRDLRTYGGRLLPLRRGIEEGKYPPMSWGRFARNAVVQGAAAELFKAWAATVRAGLPELGGEIVLCLHDELLVHTAETSAPAVVDLVNSSLARTAHWWAAGSSVRFVADVSVGGSWADAH